MGMFQLGSVMSVDDDSIHGATQESEELHEEQEWDQASDDVAGQELDPNSVRQAGREEIEYFKKLGVHIKVPIE